MERESVRQVFPNDYPPDACETDVLFTRISTSRDQLSSGRDMLYIINVHRSKRWYYGNTEQVEIMDAFKIPFDQSVQERIEKLKMECEKLGGHIEEPVGLWQHYKTRVENALSADPVGSTDWFEIDSSKHKEYALSDDELLMLFDLD